MLHRHVSASVGVSMSVSAHHPDDQTRRHGSLVCYDVTT